MPGLGLSPEGTPAAIPSMRITAYTQSIPQTAASTRRMVDLLVEPANSLPDRHPEQRPTRTLAERVIEGEIVPRPLAAEALLDDPRSRVLNAQPAPAVGQTPPGDTGLLPPTVLFYQLHSSAESLSGDPLGRNVNQFV